MELETEGTQPNAACPHPVARVYAWVARDEYGRPALCAGCCDCGEVLAGEAAPLETGGAQGQKPRS